MKLDKRSLLGISVLFTVYLVYLLGCAVLASRPGRSGVVLLPLFVHVNTYKLESVLNGTAFLTLISWGAWAWKYARDEE